MMPRMHVSELWIWGSRFRRLSSLYEHVTVSSCWPGRRMVSCRGAEVRPAIFLQASLHQWKLLMLLTCAEPCVPTACLNSLQRLRICRALAPLSSSRVLAAMVVSPAWPAEILMPNAAAFLEPGFRLIASRSICLVRSCHAPKCF